MPRRRVKTEKEPLRFRERPAGGARFHCNVPEVRAALNPKDFFKETQEHDGSTLNSWVNPQFDSSLAVLPTKKRRCPSSTSIPDNITQLSRKGVCSSSRFPTLLFQRKTREQHCKKESKASDDCNSSASNDAHHPGFSQSTIARSKRDKRIKEACQNDVSKAHHGRVSRLCNIQSLIANETSLEDSSSHASMDFVNSNIAPAPLNLSTPNMTEENPTYPHALKLLCSTSSCSPSSSSRILDILVPDTPERDYGVKVTWQRRKRLMHLLKEKGHLSDYDSMIHI